MGDVIHSAVQGALRPAQLITWRRRDGAYEDLSGAEMSGRLRNRQTGAVRPIVGVLTVTDGPRGQFLWQYAPADVVEAGEFDVQFSATFTTGPTPARSYMARWEVKAALG